MYSEVFATQKIVSQPWHVATESVRLAFAGWPPLFRDEGSSVATGGLWWA